MPEGPARMVVRGGTVVDATGSRRADVAVAGGVVSMVAADLQTPAGATVLEAGGCLVAPGLVDLHAHLREPGAEEAECIDSGARAAALGGYTAVVAMPNTDPALDSAAAVRQVLDLGAKACAEVAVAGAITVGRRGERLAPMAEMVALGVRIFTDDGTGVQSSRLMRRALEYASALGAVLAQHCEDAGLAAGGHMHEGEWSSRLGLPGVPAAAEEVMVARDLALARLTGGRLHLMHLSTAGSVALVRAAKSEGLEVTAEVTPHHLSLTDAEVAGYDPVLKVNPPLRSPEDVDALRAGLGDGTVDAIATDHAPHPQEAKELAFDQAPPGMIGLETALAVVLTHLTPAGPGPAPDAGRRPGAGPDRGPDPGRRPGAGGLDAAGVLARCSWVPAAIAGLSGRHGGPVVAGAAANLCVVDPTATWVVEPARMASRSRNTPFAGRRLTGRVRHTVYRGEPVVVDAEAQRGVGGAAPTASPSNTSPSASTSRAVVRRPGSTALIVGPRRPPPPARPGRRCGGPCR
ncbi:MAG: dihydroorotase [Acidimicrobiales bacterium]